MSESNSEHLRVAVTAMTSALRDIVRSRDCDYIDEKTRPDPCDCPRCSAVRILTLADEWRYVGAMHHRVASQAAHHPREVRIHHAWKTSVDDRLLAQILDPGSNLGPAPETPSARDWYVATSVVQWLATNVGSGLLEEAGFRYQHYDRDARARDDRATREQGRSGPAGTPAIQRRTDRVLHVAVDGPLRIRCAP